MKLQNARQLVVRDVMNSRPVSVSPSTSPRELARTLIDHGISGVPVIDNQKGVVGIVSKTDLLQWCVKGGLGFGAHDLLLSLANGGTGSQPQAIDLGIVADFMTSEPVTAQADEQLDEVARRMVEHRIHRLIVVDQMGRLCGIITSMDLLKYFPRIEHSEAA